MWLKLSTFSAFLATMEIIFLKVFKRQKGRKGKIKINQDPKRGLFRIHAFRFPATGVLWVACGFSGEAGCLHCNATLGGYYIWYTFWVGGFVTLGWSDRKLVGTEQCYKYQSCKVNVTSKIVLVGILVVRVNMPLQTSGSQKYQKQKQNS